MTVLNIKEYLNESFIQKENSWLSSSKYLTLNGLTTTQKIKALDFNFSQEILTKFILRNRYAPIYIKNEEKPVFIKIKELSHLLGISKSIIKEILRADPYSLTGLIQSHEIIMQAHQEQPSFYIINKITETLNQDQKIPLLKLISQFSMHAENSLQLLEDSEVFQALSEAVTEISPNAHVNLLERLLDHPKLYLGLQKIKDALSDGILKSVLSDQNCYEALKDLFSHLKSDVFDHLLMDNDFRNDPLIGGTLTSISTLSELKKYALPRLGKDLKELLKNEKCLIALKHLNPDLDNVFDKIVKGEKVHINILRITLQAVEKTFSKLASDQPIYVAKEKGNHYGYLIKGEDIYIHHKMLGQGLSKKASVIFNLTNPQEEEVHLAIRGPKAQFYMQKEMDMLTHFKGCEHILPPFKVVVETKTKTGEPKWIAIQRKLTDGAQLLNTSPSPLHLLHILVGVAKGLTEMHHRQVVHSDLKPGNLLFEGDFKKQLKGYVHDFGFSSKGKKGKDSLISYSHLGGTPAYSPPELFKALMPLINEMVKDTKDRDLNQPKILKAAEEKDRQMTIKVDSFAFGETILDLLNETEIDEFLPEIEDQDDMDDFIDLQTAAFKARQDWTKKEKQIALNLLTIARQALLVDPSQRISCEKAADKLEQLVAKYPL
jgi:hypothetical protein